MTSLRVRYETYEIGGVDIHVRSLMDTRQYEDDGEAESYGVSSASWGLFGVVWDSGRALAHLMADYEVGDRRVLEIGCGLGLASLVLRQRNIDVTATDYQPRAGDFLDENVKLNGLDPIPFVRASWDDDEDELGRFDLIIGSDILYEPDHAETVSNFIHRHAADTCEIVILDPGREIRGRFNRRMGELGYTQSRTRSELVGDSEFSAHILTYTRG